MPFHAIPHNSAERNKIYTVCTILPLFDNICLLFGFKSTLIFVSTLENFKETEPFINKTESQLFIDILNGKGEGFFILKLFIFSFIGYFCVGGWK